MFGKQRSSDNKTPLLSDRQFARKMPFAIGQTKFFKRCTYRLSIGTRSLNLCREQEILFDSKRLEQIRALENKPDALPMQRVKSFRRGTCKILASVEHRPRIGSQYPAHNAQERRLPFTRNSGDRNHLTCINLKIKLRKRLYGRICLKGFFYAD
nr:hypothetical protein [Raoultibacter phocaeensis]